MKTQTKQIMSEIGKDARRGLARAGKSTAKGLAQIVCKASYPVLGNLSNSLQTRIEKAVGKEYYNAEDAFGTTLVTNAIIYSGLGGYFAYENPDGANKILTGMIGGFLGFASGYSEGLFRDSGSRFDNHGKYNKDEVLQGKPFTKEFQQPVASLPGKIVSLPFDAMTYAYDAGKKYLENVRRRLEGEDEK